MTKLGQNRGKHTHHLGFLSVLWVMLTILQGCSSSPTSAQPAVVPSVSATPKPSALPTGVFDKKTANVKPPSNTVPAIRAQPLITAPVMLYASPATQAYFAKTDVDGKVNVRVWETFLRKYKIPFQIVSSVEQLEKSQSRVIVLPSSVVLTDREKQAIIAFRAKGGGRFVILANRGT
jgi:hypothetical protein